MSERLVRCNTQTRMHRSPLASRNFFVFHVVSWGNIFFFFFSLAELVAPAHFWVCKYFLICARFWKELISSYMWQKNRCLCGNTDALGVFRTSWVDAANYLEKQRCQSVQFNQREEDWGKKYPECNQQRLMGTGSMQTYGVTKINQVISRTTGRERDFFSWKLQGQRWILQVNLMEKRLGRILPQIKRKGQLRCRALCRRFYDKIPPIHILITIIL